MCCSRTRYTPELKGELALHWLDQKGTQIRSVMLKATVNAWLVFGVGMIDRENTYVFYMF